MYVYIYIYGRPGRRALRGRVAAAGLAGPAAAAAERGVVSMLQATVVVTVA